MATLTIRLPDVKHARLKALAQARDVSMNRLFDEWATAALVQHGALTQCTARRADPMYRPRRTRRCNSRPQIAGQTGSTCFERH